MSSTDATQLFGDEHARRYRETDGELGHIWKEGSTILLLTTTGRRSGERRPRRSSTGSTATRR
jgi:F420H(2)-dependent quinone reductase